MEGKKARDKVTKSRKRSKAAKREATSPPHTEVNKLSKKPAREKDMEKGPELPDHERIDNAIIELASRVGDTVDTQSEIISTMNVHSDNLLGNKRKIDALQVENQRLSKRLNNMDVAFKSAMERLGTVEKTADANSQMLKNANIVVDGLAEMDNENCSIKVCDIFGAIDSKFSGENIITAYRVGQRSKDGKYPRPMVVKLIDVSVKVMIMENKGKLMNHPDYSRIFLNDDLPPKLKKERKTLREISRYAHYLGYRGCRASGSKLVINGKAFRYETLHLLPQELQLCNLKTRNVGDGIGFQGEDSYLSNFYPVTLTVEDQCFNCAEQAFQFFKARTCKRDDMASKILTQSNPRDIKTSGDSFPTTAVWEAHKEAFMRSVVYSKFAKNEEIKMKLLATQETPLYECVTNRWWGCGLHLDSPEWNNGVCPGLNKTGQIIMDVRKALRKSTWSGDAMSKSPSKIIKAITSLSDEIQGHQTSMIPDRYEIPMIPEVENPNMATQQPVDMDTDQPKEGSAAESTDDDTDTDLLEATDVDEESVDISVTSTTSEASSSKLNVTGEDGKLDLTKIRKWTVPKLKKPDELHQSNISDRTRGQQLRNTLPLEAAKGLAPKATSTPQARGVNRSLTIQAVRSKLHPGKITKKTN